MTRPESTTALTTSAPPPLLTNALTFVRALRSAGLPVALDQTLRFVEALGWVDLADRSQVFFTARALLVTRQQDLKLFEILFNRFWSARPAPPPRRPRKAPRAPRHDSAARPFTIATYLAYKARRFDEEIEITDRSGTASDDELLQRKDFSALHPQELGTVRRLMANMDWQIAQRRTRRRTRSPRGADLDPRACLRRAARTGGVPMDLPRRTRKIKPRPLVLIADISGSMEKLSRLILQFFYGVTHGLGRPAQGAGDVESFVFGTRLTRITPEIRLRNIDRALDEASQQVVDWNGGTRIGECLGAFNRAWGRRVLRRGAVVLLVSDGWEHGDTDVLRRELDHLRRRCSRLIWLNPLAGRADYRPLVGGMSVALPLVDDFLPIHNLQSLQALADHLRTLGKRL